MMKYSEYVNHRKSVVRTNSIIQFIMEVLLLLEILGVAICIVMNCPLHGMIFVVLTVVTYNVLHNIIKRSYKELDKKYDVSETYIIK